ncbi:uncharacterized protein LOC116346176 [Contarinia nasturtii]|uniref:uncharacterized protein LOC116346176 n=1 Tax=Contarinia nasturtii TaxID=265458 RepID=UPI0012D3CC20|nr:uncharacterized protein LOC116346176 [Contarinia nasturtii]
MKVLLFLSFVAIFDQFTLIRCVKIAADSPAFTTLLDKLIPKLKIVDASKDWDQALKPLFKLSSHIINDGSNDSFYWVNGDPNANVFFNRTKILAHIPSTSPYQTFRSVLSDYIRDLNINHRSVCQRHIFIFNTFLNEPKANDTDGYLKALNKFSNTKSIKPKHLQTIYEALPGMSQSHNTAFNELKEKIASVMAIRKDYLAAENALYATVTGKFIGKFKTEEYEPERVDVLLSAINEVKQKFKTLNKPLQEAVDILEVYILNRMKWSEVLMDVKFFNRPKKTFFEKFCFLLPKMP